MTKYIDVEGSTREEEETERQRVYSCVRVCTVSLRVRVPGVRCASDVSRLRPSPRTRTLAGPEEVARRPDTHPPHSPWAVSSSTAGRVAPLLTRRRLSPTPVLGTDTESQRVCVLLDAVGARDGQGLRFRPSRTEDEVIPDRVLRLDAPPLLRTGPVDPNP